MATPPVSPPLLSLVVPAFNEARAIRAGNLQAMRAWLEARPGPVELIVADDGSQDNTAHLATTFASEVLYLPHRGKGPTLTAGLAAARGDWVLFTDMDLAVPIAEGDLLLAALEAGADLAIGSRGWRRPGAPLPRQVLSFGHTLLHRLLIPLPILDTQCGFKAFRRSALLQILPRLSFARAMPAAESPAPRPQPAAAPSPAPAPLPDVSSGWDLEVLLLARRLGLKVAEVPVHWNYQYTRHVHTWRDALRGLRELFRLRRLVQASEKSVERPQAS